MDLPSDQRDATFDDYAKADVSRPPSGRACSRWPDVPVASIHCRDDRAVNPLSSKWIASQRFGVESVELPGGPSPMISRPALLAETLATLAGRTLAAP